MARMQMMGRASIAYHAKTLGIGTVTAEMGLDPDIDAVESPALRYYSTHGETPLVWGGSGAAAFGLEGAVTTAQYEAVFAEGGAADPTTGVRLVRTKRPGMELVISAQKSVAELGVIGRPEDMHAILSAETAATLAYLDSVTRLGGGRRGRGGEPVATEGLVYLRTRHATSRAGDPSPHDHVLVANVVQMLDDRGGFKAADTTVWRNHLHAATMTGRMASAAKAVELGYGIEADPGPSGKLGHWRIAGVPKAVEEVHSKRAAEITLAMAEGGFVSPRAKEVAANETRPRKRHEPIADLMSRWTDELDSAGYPVPELSAMVDTAARHRRVPSLSWDELRRRIATVLSSEGTLGRRKVFTRADAVVALAPSLYGLRPRALERAVDRLISDPEVIPLVGVPGARQRAYSTASTLAIEEAIAQSLGRAMERSDGPAVSFVTVGSAIDRAEASLGRSLTPGQVRLVHAATGSRRGAELCVGVAGSGKTAALSVVREAFEAEGFTVIGTATSGQAAQNLGREAGIGLSRTLASINWRIEHGSLTLTNRHVVILDEVGATDDPALLRLLARAERAGAKVVMTGDWRQLGPVGPGGAFEALLRRHKEAVITLGDNVRQLDPAEAQALLALRSGSVPDAVDFYAGAGRLRTAATRTEAIDAAVAAWSDDALAGRDVLLMAWRRENVDGLNRRARAGMDDAGTLSGPELAVGARAYRAGDQVVTLAPTAGGELATSTRAVVTAVDLATPSLTVRAEDGRTVTLSGPDISRDHLDWGYATTVHRSQGATSARAHLLADGGGRELAYVGMSRAREASFAYVVADDLDQAKEDLVAEWSSIRRPRWVIDMAAPAPDEQIARVPTEDQARRLAYRRALITAQYDAAIAAAPRGVARELAEAGTALRALEAERADLLAGRGAYRGAVGPALDQLQADEAQARAIQHRLAQGPGFLERRRLGRDLARTEVALEASRQGYEAVVKPHRVRLEVEIGAQGSRLSGLQAKDMSERLWVTEHPEAGRRVRTMATEITKLERVIEHRRLSIEGREPRLSPPEQTLARRMQKRLEYQPEPPTPEQGMSISL